MTTLVTIRPGVTFEADAAASFRRLEAEVGTIACNSTWRDPLLQDRMHAASVAYEKGTGPYPGHSYAVPSRESYHCAGLAFDANRAYSIRAAARRHGWVHVNRKGEEHHLERRAALDQYRNHGAPASGGATATRKDNIMADREYYRHGDTGEVVVITNGEMVSLNDENARKLLDIDHINHERNPQVYPSVPNMDDKDSFFNLDAHGWALFGALYRYRPRS